MRRWLAIGGVALLGYAWSSMKPAREQPAEAPAIPSARQLEPAARLPEPLQVPASDPIADGDSPDEPEAAEGEPFRVSDETRARQAEFLRAAEALRQRTSAASFDTERAALKEKMLAEPNSGGM